MEKKIDNNNDSNEIGINIKKIRRAKKMSRDELGKKIGLSKHAIAKYEVGQRTPDSYVLGNISKALEVSADELLGHDSINKSGIETDDFPPKKIGFAIPLDRENNSNSNEISNENDESIYNFRFEATNFYPLDKSGQVEEYFEIKIDWYSYNILECYDSLNRRGKKEAYKRISELTEIKKYKNK